MADSHPATVPRAASARPARWLSGAMLALAIALLAWLSLGLAPRWRASLDYPFQLDAEEGFLLNQAVRLAQGRGIYTPIDQPPYLVGNYPPLYPALYALVHGSRARPASLPVGRAIVQAATVLSALLLALIAWRATRRPAPLLLAPVLFLAAYEVHHWSAFARVDLPALALTLAGLALFLEGRRPAHLVASALLFVAAACTRQTAVMAPLACCLLLAWTDRRGLAWFAGAWVGGGLLALAALQAATRGEFWRHVVAYNVNSFDWSAWRAVMRNEVWFFHRWILLACAGIALGPAFASYSARRRSAVPAAEAATAPPPRASAAWPVAGLFALLTTAFSLPAMAKIGSAPNYLLEPLAAWALVIALALGHPLDRRSNAGAGGRSGARSLAALLLAACLLLHAGHLVRLRPVLHSSRNPTPADREALRPIVADLRAQPGPVYAEEPVLALLAGKEVLFQPFILSQLAREGRWRDAGWVAMLEDRTLTRLVVNEDLSAAGPDQRYRRYTATTAAAVRENYRPAGAISRPGLATYYVWEPKIAE